MLSLPNYLNTNTNRKYIYKMKPHDSLILYKENNHTYNVVEGILIIHKCFSNKEKFTISILGKNAKIDLSFPKSSTGNYFYIIEALSISYITKLNSISCPTQAFQNRNRILTYISLPYFSNMGEIFVHKTIKNRLIHLLLQLSQMCGIQYGSKIYLMVHLSYKTLSCITGTKQNTVRKLIKLLINHAIIEYKAEKIIINDLILLSTFYCKERST